MANKKRSPFFKTVHDHLSAVMTIVYNRENGEKLTEAEIKFALLALELVANEIKKELCEVSYV